MISRHNDSRNKDYNVSSCSLLLLADILSCDTGANIHSSSTLSVTNDTEENLVDNNSMGIDNEIVNFTDNESNNFTKVVYIVSDIPNEKYVVPIDFLKAPCQEYNKINNVTKKSVCLHSDNYNTTSDNSIVHYILRVVNNNNIDPEDIFTHVQDVSIQGVTLSIIQELQLNCVSIIERKVKNY